MLYLGLVEIDPGMKFVSPVGSALPDVMQALDAWLDVRALFSSSQAAMTLPSGKKS